MTLHGASVPSQASDEINSSFITVLHRSPALASIQPISLSNVINLTNEKIFSCDTHDARDAYSTSIIL